MSTSQEVAETVKSVHVQYVPVPGSTSVQEVIPAVIPGKLAPRVGPTTIIIQSVSNLVASMEPEDLDTPPFTAQERLIYVHVDIMNTMV